MSKTGVRCGVACSCVFTLIALLGIALAIAFPLAIFPAVIKSVFSVFRNIQKIKTFSNYLSMPTAKANFHKSLITGQSLQLLTLFHFISSSKLRYFSAANTYSQKRFFSQFILNASMMSFTDSCILALPIKMK
jgi:hypothetical protein